MAEGDGKKPRLHVHIPRVLQGLHGGYKGLRRNPYRCPAAAAAVAEDPNIDPYAEYGQPPPGTEWRYLYDRGMWAPVPTQDVQGNIDLYGAFTAPPARTGGGLSGFFSGAPQRQAQPMPLDAFLLGGVQPPPEYGRR